MGRKRKLKRDGTPKFTHGGKRRNAGRKPLGKLPRVRVTYTLSEEAIARLEAFRFTGESSSSALNRVIMQHHQVIRDPKAPGP